MWHLYSWALHASKGTPSEACNAQLLTHFQTTFKVVPLSWSLSTKQVMPLCRRYQNNGTTTTRQKYSHTIQVFVPRRWSNPHLTHFRAVTSLATEVFISISRFLSPKTLNRQFYNTLTWFQSRRCRRTVCDTLVGISRFVIPRSMNRTLLFNPFGVIMEISTWKYKLSLQ